MLDLCVLNVKGSTMYGAFKLTIKGSKIDIAIDDLEGKPNMDILELLLYKPGKCVLKFQIL